MAGKSGPETRLVARMRTAAIREYGDKIVLIKHHGGPHARAGVSDLLACVDGVFVACEVKAPESYGGSVEKALADGPTPLQRKFLEDVIGSGGVAGVAATVEQFMEILLCAYDRENGWGICGQTCDGHNMTPKS